MAAKNIPKKPNILDVSKILDIFPDKPSIIAPNIMT